MKLSTILILIILLLGPIINAFSVWRSIQEEVRLTALDTITGLRVNYIITPTRAAKLPNPLGSTFDVSSTGNVVIRGGDMLLELEINSDGLVAGEMSPEAPDSLAYDRGSTLLAISGQYFGQLEEDGKFSKAVPLPGPGMQLASSTMGGGVYLFGGSGVSSRRVYALSETGHIGIIAELPEPITAITDSPRAVYIGTEREIFRAVSEKIELVIRLPEDAGIIRSLAISQDEQTIFFATEDRVYAMRGAAALAIVKNAGGVLRLHDGALYLWDATRNLLVSFPAVEQSL